MHKRYENKKSSCLQNWDVNNLYDWTMSQKFPVNNKCQRHILNLRKI